MIIIILAFLMGVAVASFCWTSYGLYTYGHYWFHPEDLPKNK